MFNFVTTMLSYHIIFKNLLDTHDFFIYVYLTGSAPGFWFGGTSDKSSYMNSSQVLYCNGVAKISVLGDIQQECTRQTLLKNIEKFIKDLHKNLKILQNFLKIKFNRI